MIVYCTTNLLNGKKYIGLDSNNIPNYLGSGILLQRAIKKHGKENFKKQILENCITKDNLNEAEKYWIDYFGAVKSDLFYNVSEGGIGGDTLSNHPNKNIIIKRITESRKRTYDADPEKYKRAEQKRQITLQKERELNGCFIKRPLKTKAVKLRIAEKLGKSIVQLDFKGNFIAEHISIIKAAKSVNGFDSGITPCLKHETTTAYGFIWVYKQDYLKNKYSINRTTSKKPVIQLDLQGNFIAEFESITEASNKTEIKNVWSACNGYLFTAGGFKWMYKTDYELLLNKVV